MLMNYIKLFFWGIITAGMALIVQILLTILSNIDIDLNKLAVTSIFFLASFVLIEELLKYLIITRRIIPFAKYKNKIIISSWVAGMGFSMIELFILYQNNITLNRLDLTQVALLHIFTFGFLGYRLATKKYTHIDLLAIIFVFILHFIYNFSALYFTNNLSFITKASIITILFISNIFALFIVNKKLAQEQ